MLHRLGVNPFADQLLLASHMVHEALNCLGEIGHCARRGPAGSAFAHDVAQLFDRGVDFARGVG